jgi:hypothetical protein
VTEPDVVEAGLRSSWREAYLRPAGFVLVLLCFALPFATVSCDDGSQSATYTGYALATGRAPAMQKPGLQFLSNEAAAEAMKVRPLVIASILAAVAGALLVLVWRRRAGRWAGAASSILGGIVLVFGQLGARRDFATAAAPADGALVFHDRFGYWLTLAAFALAAVMCALPGRRRPA